MKTSYSVASALESHVTDYDIYFLESEAENAGATDERSMCLSALRGCDWARYYCVRQIRNIRAEFAAKYADDEDARA